jgi:flagellar basal-body rod protein FlgB
MSDMGITVGGGLFGSESIPVLESVLSHAHQRHTILANNIANMNTPGFRSQDLPEGEFRQNLQRAIDARETGARPLEFSAGFSMRPAAGGGFEMVPVNNNGEALMRNDNSDVSVEEEMAKQLKNGLTIQVFNRLLSDKFRVLGTAISMRV